MELSAILNAPSASGAQTTSLSPTSGTSSPTSFAHTPRTPMDTSPAPSTSSHSPEEAGRWRHQQHVRGVSEGWKRGEAERWNGNGQHEPWRSEMADGCPGGSHLEGWKGRGLDWQMTKPMSPEQMMASEHVRGHRPRRQTYACQPAAGRVSSPCEDAYGSGWQLAYPGMDERERDREAGRGRERLPSVHELFSDYCSPSPYQGPSTSSFSTTISPHQEPAACPYDTDATISEAGSGSSAAASPEADPLLPSSPVSPASYPSFASASSFSNPSFPRSYLPSKPKCAFVPDCTLPAPPRRIVSHYFGRNKKETRAIPESVWVFYCRQHYQRAKYRQRTHVYAQTQMRLVRQTVENLQAWGGVTDFAINLRKRAVLLLKREDEGGKGAGTGSASAHGVNAYETVEANDERWLLPFTGPHKSFAEVYDVIARVAERARVRQSPAAEFELVPNIKPEYMRRAREGRKEE